MKHILLVAALFAQTALCQAEDNLHFPPFSTTAGYGLDGDGEMTGDGTVNILLNNSDNEEYVGLQFSMHVPHNMQVTFDIDGCTRIKPKKLGKNHHVHTISDPLESEKYPGYDYYIVTISDQTDNCAFLGESGDNIMTMYYGIPEDFAEGVYPIYMTDVQLVYINASYKALDAVTSYMVVGNPTNASLTMEGEIPSFVNEKLATETAITNLNLSAVTKVNGTFTYVDGRAVTAPADQNVKAEHVAYTRTIGDGKYGSFKAPFAVSGCSNFYKFKNLEANYVNFTETNDIVAGDDLLATGVIDLSADNVALTNVPAPHTVDDVYFFYSEDGKFYHGSNITINPFRTFWTIGSDNSNLMMAIDGELTGIELNTIDGQNNSSYDLQGRRNENARHGIFVTNGKKQIVK